MNFINLLFTKGYFGGQIKDNEMGKAGRSYGEDDECTYKVKPDT
jgi:hypothetical protein